MHKKGDLSKVNANSLLSFGFDEDAYDKKKKKAGEAPKINDNEGVDFGFYFSAKYQLQNERKRKAPPTN